MADSITPAIMQNARLDALHIADLATSPAPTATDRLGNEKLTWSGLIAGVEASKVAAIADMAADVAAVDTAKDTAINVDIPARVALVDEAVAATYVGQAQAAAAEAEAYAALAATGAEFRDSIALGLLAVVDGASFGVLPGGVDALERPTIFRRDSAVAYTPLYEVLAWAEFDAAVTALDARIDTLENYLAVLVPNVENSLMFNLTGNSQYLQLI